ncbi:peroxiredoxin-like family protein [Microscilla marina]|uniref:thioredoxin-dependent peroxiredoxin n=1 Tax=Microscilla marina ATCC 23134 TaxID=313606 RepID=A1ZKK7_MICM2|nr:peroxiredoxin-like family protein [Microscilla marina]EAY29233.1 antioxidant, AhpC/TSA family [Microscilla marina ATCC 23134]
MTTKLTKTLFALTIIALLSTAFRVGDPLPEKAEDVSPLLVGEKIPKVTLNNTKGEAINLQKMVSNKPTVLIFYRGGWCPYCNRQLAGLQKIEKQVLALGYQIVAISPDSPQNLKKTMDKNTLSYTLVSDASADAAKAFGIAFRAPKKYGRWLSKSSGGKNTENILPVPSVFVLNKKGTIKFEYINPNYKERLSPELLLAAAKLSK